MDSDQQDIDLLLLYIDIFRYIAAVDGTYLE